MSTKRALIVGITGQDGSFLAELLLSKGYQVFGLKRRTSSSGLSRIAHLLNSVHLLEGDLCDGSSLERAVMDCLPDEVYNLGAQSFVRTSFRQPLATTDVNGLGAVRLLEAIASRHPSARYYQASSSEMFGTTPPPHSETSVFHPRSPYACAKVYAHHMTVHYREAYGLYACNGILYNHESPRRGRDFVTQKIAYGAAAIHLGMSSFLTLGSLDTRRDWGHARDFCDAIWLMMQQSEPEDYVIATGESHSVEDFARLAFQFLGMDYKNFVGFDPALLRRTDISCSVGDATKARTKLGWAPKVSFDQLVEEMVSAAHFDLKNGRTLSLEV